jgi:hypothetical protein
MRFRSRSKKYITTIQVASLFLFSIALLVMTNLAYGGNVIGRLDYQGPSGSASPAPHIQVTLVDPVQKRSSSTFTGFDGMYYFYNVPSGEYILEIRSSENKPPINYKITVRNQPYTSLKPIPLPR